MKRLAIACSILALLTGCATNADLDNTRMQMMQVNQQASARLSQIEAKLSNERLLDMVSQLEGLKAQVSKLNGEIDVINYNLQSAQKRQNDMYADLDTRLGRLEGGVGHAASNASAPTAQSQGEPEDKSSAEASPDYQQALNLLRQHDFQGAVSALDQFIKQNPDDANLADAAFWLGVAHTALKQYDAAIVIHRRFVKDYPNNSKAPDALRNIASSQLALGQQDEARVTLKRLIKLYPKTAAASKARQTLKTL